MTIDELVDQKVKAALSHVLPEYPDALRLARGMEVQDLAAKAGISEDTIRRYEAGTVAHVRKQ